MSRRLHIKPARLLLARLRVWAVREEASLSIEAVLVLPFLIWAFAAMYAFFDVYRDRALAMKGNYAVADLLSRETNSIDMTYLRGTEKVYTYLTQSGKDSWIRVTSVRCQRRCNDEARRVLRRDWSRATDGKPRLSSSDVDRDFRDLVPMIARGDRVIMVETFLRYTPKINPILTGVQARDIYDISMTRPRFSPQLCWGSLTCLNE